MDNAEMKKKLEELVDNEAFIADLKKVDGKDDLQKVLAAYGMELTKEEIDIFTAEVEKILEGDEIPEDELEQVSGGVGGWDIFKTVVSWGKDIWKAAWKLGKKFANWEDKRK